MTVSHRFQQRLEARAISIALLLLVAAPVANADMIWFQRSSGEWFLRNNLNLVPVDSLSFFNEFFTDTGSPADFTETFTGSASSVFPVDIRVDLAQPVDAFSINHEITDLLQSGGAGAIFNLTYEFFDSAGKSLGKMSTAAGMPPELMDITEIEVPRIEVDSGPVDPEVCVRGNSRRSGCYPITSDSGITGTSEENPDTPNPYARSFEYAFVSLDQPIASLALSGDLETLFFVDFTEITLSGRSGDYDLDAFAAASGFPLDGPAAVPLPAGGWLFLSALASIVGLRRAIRN